MIDERTLLRTFHDDQARPDDLALARARAQLMARTQQPSRRAGWSWSGGPRMAVAAVATAGLVGGLAMTQTLAPGGATASAAEVLDRAATAAGRQVPALPGPGQFLYQQYIDAQIEFIEDRELKPDKLCFGASESWTPAESTDPVRIHRADGVTAASARTPGELVKDPECEFYEFTDDGVTDNDGVVIMEGGTVIEDGEGTPFVPPGGEAGGEWGAPDAAFAAALPTDPRALYERARADAAGFRYELVDEGALTLLTDAAVSESPHLTPALRAALFRAVAFVPGVELGGTATTLWGDQGQVVSRVEPARGERTEIVFDAASGDFLGSRSISVDPALTGLPDGTVVAEQASRSTMVGALGERPTG